MPDNQSRSVELREGEASQPLEDSSPKLCPEMGSDLTYRVRWKGLIEAWNEATLDPCGPIAILGVKARSGHDPFWEQDQVRAMVKALSLSDVHSPDLKFPFAAGKPGTANKNPRDLSPLLPLLCVRSPSAGRRPGVKGLPRGIN